MYPYAYIMSCHTFTYGLGQNGASLIVCLLYLALSLETVNNPKAFGHHQNKIIFM